MTYGHGRIDALAAMQRLLSSGHLTGVIRDAGTSQPIPGAEVKRQGMGYDLDYVADAGGVYSATYLLAGTYTLTASYYGYETGSVGGVTIVTDTVTVQDLSLTALPTHTLSGYVTEAGSGDPLTATVRALGTPLAPAPTDASGYYSLVVAEGEYDVEAHSFAHATGLQHVVMDQDRTLTFSSRPCRPSCWWTTTRAICATIRPTSRITISAALAANDYNYTYWDIEAQGGAPDFDTSAPVRRRALVRRRVWTHQGHQRRGPGPDADGLPGPGRAVVLHRPGAHLLLWRRRSLRHRPAGLPLHLRIPEPGRFRRGPQGRDGAGRDRRPGGRWPGAVCQPVPALRGRFQRRPHARHRRQHRVHRLVHPQP